MRVLKFPNLEAVRLKKAKELEEYLQFGIAGFCSVRTLAIYCRQHPDKKETIRQELKDRGFVFLSRPNNFEWLMEKYPKIVQAECIVKK